MTTSKQLLTEQEQAFLETLPPYTKRLSKLHPDYLRKLMQDPGMIASHESDFEMQACGSE